MRKLLRIFQTFLILILCNCSSSQRNNSSRPQYSRLNNVESIEIEWTNKFAFEVYTNFYGGQFPQIDRNIASSSFLASWEETQKRLSRTCNKYGHLYGKPEKFKLYEIAGDKYGKKYFVYRITFPKTQAEHRLILIKNEKNLLSDIQHLQRWRSLL